MTNIAQVLNEHPSRSESLREWVYLIGATILLVSLVGIAIT